MIKLINGNTMPQIAYGTWRIENGNPTTEAVMQAIECGYCHIDTAAAYGNDFAVGKAIKRCGVARENLFITNKVWNSCRGYEQTVMACKRTLKLMKLEYLDVYLIHWPASSAVYSNWDEINSETWRGMELLQKEGLVKNIGVSNFLQHHLSALLQNASVSPAINQFEMHPGKPQADLVSYCKEKGITPMAWSPLGHGEVLSSPVILELSKKYGKSPAQICLRYVLQSGLCLVTRSVNKERMRENLDIMDYILTAEDMEKIDSIEGIGDTGLHPDDVMLDDKLSRF